MEAVSVAGNDGWDGVGYVFSADDPYVGVDLDNGLSEADRGAIMVALDSYTETSVRRRAAVRRFSRSATIRSMTGAPSADGAKR
jgi:primase-polymerase (primpol)-like protein